MRALLSEKPATSGGTQMEGATIQSMPGSAAAGGAPLHGEQADSCGKPLDDGDTHVRIGARARLPFLDEMTSSSTVVHARTEHRR